MTIKELRDLRQGGYLTKEDLFAHVTNFVIKLPGLTFGELAAYRSEIRKGAEALDCMIEVDSLANKLYNNRAE